MLQKYTIKLALIFVGFVSLLLSGCNIIPTGSRTPEHYPQTDIVFQRAVAPSEAKDLRYSLGFVNADGTGLSVVEMDSNGRFLMFPVWSRDGSMLVFRSSAAYGVTGNVAIARAAKTVLHCSGKNSYGLGRVSLLEEEGQAVLIRREPPDELALIDLNNCKVVRTYLKSNSGDKVPQGVSAIQSGQSLVFGYSRTLPSYDIEDSIIVLDVASGTQRVIASGINPAWSPDGQWIAYTGRDGIYIAKQDGSQVKRVSVYAAFRKVLLSTPPTKYTWEDWPPLPSWSPDGKWLVYHKCMVPFPERECREKASNYSIFKLNVETGEEIKIVDGGLNPYWRWNLPSKP